MGKALIIAEKPSVAGDIAKALKGFTKHKEYYESDQYVLCSAVGHLLAIFAPEDKANKGAKWKLTSLPVIPVSFSLQPTPKTEPRLKLLMKLMKRKDVNSLINACDAGREGELIFRYIVQYAKVNKSIQRLWLQSMTPSAIREGFSALRQDDEMKPLADAAICRSESDWLVGINGTRAMTAMNSLPGGFQLTTVGRVQTPTLMLIVEREQKIQKFTPKDYWELHATFQAEAGNYAARWFDQQFSRDKSKDTHLKAERIWELKQAEALRGKCLGKTGTVTEESKPSTQLAPLLFDLTSLQREANSRFGFSAKSTLQIAQALYERHKVLTYPRTDSRALPEDYPGTVKKIMNSLVTSTKTIVSDVNYSVFAAEILKNNWIKLNKRIFNNAKISDHFAIIPTPLQPKTLRDNERKIYDLVVRRFLAIFYPPAEYLVTARITLVENETFKTDGKVMVKPGWLAIYGRKANADNATVNLVAVKPDEKVHTSEIEVVPSQTTPPARFSEATLLSAMEGAGKLVEDEELREAMSAKGLGTAATRSVIIEGLIYERYLARIGRELIPTAKAFELSKLLRLLDISELCSPELTGDWEFKLKQMELNQLNRPEFMREITEMTKNIVHKIKSHAHEAAKLTFTTQYAPCPKCGKQIGENSRQLSCQACDFSIWKDRAGHYFTVKEIEELFTKRTVGPLHDFRSRKGRIFSATVKLTDDYKIDFEFAPRAGEPGATVEPIDFTGHEPLGKCPKCGNRIFEIGNAYVCESICASPAPCDFRCGTVILDQRIEQEQIVKILTSGKTDLLPRFISRKGRPFRAYLVLTKECNIGFEFMNKSKAPKKKQPTETQAGPQQKKDGAKREPVAELPGRSKPGSLDGSGKAGVGGQT